MIRNYITVALRKFKRQKFYSLVNLFGLTIGLTSVILIMLYVVDELSYDRFHEKSHRIYRVVENQFYAGQPVFPVAVTPAPLGPALEKEYANIEKGTRVWSADLSFKVNDELLYEAGIYVDESFFEIFSFEIVDGNTASMLSEANSIVLTEKLVKKYFSSENPIGKLLRVGDRELQVSGVIKDVPDNSHIHFDFLIPIENALLRNERLRDNWGNNTMYTYVLVQDGADITELNTQIVDRIKKNNERSTTDIYLQPLTDIHLGAVHFTADARGKGNMQYVAIFLVVAIFILVIACINFMNLATARSISRSKEVGLRKSIGANRHQLVLQFLSESVFTALIAMALAILLVDLLLPQFNLLAGKTLSLNFSSNYLLLFYLLGFSVLTGLVAGSYPAFFLSSFEPASVLKSNVMRKSGGSWFRKVLVVTQFCISMVMIVGTIVVYAQLEYIRSKNLGYTKENVVKIPRISDDYVSFKNELMSQSGIVDVTAADQHPAYVGNSTSGIEWEGKGEDENILIHTLIADFDFLETMGMKLEKGRSLSKEYGTDSSSVILNEAAVEMMGFSNPIGQKLEVGMPQPYTVVGVVNDFHFKSIHQKIEPLAIFIGFNMRSYNYTLIRMEAGDPKGILASIENTWMKFNADNEFAYTFLDDDFNAVYKAEEQTGTIFKYFSALAIIISCLGLFGLASFTLEQRTKEFGVRKIFGASMIQLFSTASIGFLSLVLIAFVISIPISWYFINQWLNGFAYHATLGYQYFLWSGLIAMVIALLTVSYQAIKSALLNPVDSLRHE
ncbi:MAG: ABC transporter permease [Cyclobacteriaceae bacterium]|nr:ABC transporter permease [Cyclobacteriaceae bacterium]